MADSDIADELLREVRRLRHELDDIQLAHIRRFRDECHAHMKAWYEKVEAMVSVPTHWTRRVWHPLRTADALASIVAGRTDLSWLPILKRVRAGPHQIGLSYNERVQNVRDAFALRRGVKLRDARLLLIDDVKTTGATINECAKTLRRGGAAEVYAAVVVTAEWDQSTGQVPPPI